MKAPQSNPPISLTRSWLVWGCVALFYGYQFVLRVSPTAMTTELMEAFSVEGYALGTLSALYYYAYAFLQVPAGSLIDRFGPRKMVSFGALLCTAGTFLFASATSLAMASIGRFIVGVGAAFGYLSCFKVATTLFPPKKVSLVVGLTFLMGVGGATLAGKPLVLLVQTFGWRQVLLGCAMGGALISLLAWFCIDMAPVPRLEAYMRTQFSTNTHSEAGSQNIRSIIRNPQLWLISTLAFFLYSPLSGFAGLWGAPFLKHKFDLSVETASLGITFMYIGFGVGSPFAGKLVDWFKSYKAGFYAATLGPAIWMGVLLYTPASAMSYPSLLAVLFLLGLFVSHQLHPLAAVAEITPPSASSTVGGIVNTFCMASGIIFQPLIGWLLDYACSDCLREDRGVYTAQHFVSAVSSIPLGLLIGAILIFFIRNTYTPRS